MSALRACCVSPAVVGHIQLWLPPTWEISRANLASYQHAAKEGRLCWVVCSHRICQCKRCMTASQEPDTEKHSLILEGCLERRTDSNSDKAETMPNARKQRRSAQEAREECAARVSEVPRSPAIGMSKQKQNMSYRWEQESTLNASQAQRGQRWLTIVPGKEKLL